MVHRVGDCAECTTSQIQTTQETNRSVSVEESSSLWTQAADALNHGLRGSASPVLTATDFVNGRWQFSTPHRINTPWPITKNLVQVITSAAPTAAPNLVQIRRWGLLDKWVKYNENYFLFIYTFFSWTHLQVRRDDGFSRLMAQTTRTRARMCLLGGFLTLLPILGVKSPENPNFWGVNRLLSSSFSEWKCADTIGAVLVSWTGHFQC